MRSTFVHYPAGKEPTTFVAGDILLVRDKDLSWIGELINSGSQVRHGKSWFTHSALITSTTGQIIEADESGVLLEHIGKYRFNDYVVVTPQATKEQRTLAVTFAESHLHDLYGKLEFAGLAIQCLFTWNISIAYDDHFICSGLVARATEKYIATYQRSPESMMPDDLAAYWEVVPPFPDPKRGFLENALLGLKAILSVAFGKGDPPTPIGG